MPTVCMLTPFFTSYLGRRSLYGCWRRLAAEKFPHYTEGWLWVPSLAQPNPDFQFKQLGGS